MPIAFVNTAHTQNTSASSTVSVTVSTTSGNALVVGVGLPDDDTTVLYINDNVSSGYQFWARVSNGTGPSTEIWLCPTLAGAATTVTVTLSASVNATAITGEYSGSFMGNAAYSATGTSTSASLAQANLVTNDFMIAAISTLTTATYTGLGGSDTLRGSVAGSATNVGMGLADNHHGGTGSLTTGANLSSSSAWSLALVEILAAAKSATLANNTLSQLGAGV